MKKKYILNGKIYYEDELTSYAQKSNLGLSDYLKESGAKEHIDNNMYSLNGKDYSGNDLADFAKKSNLPYQDYLSEAGAKKKVTTVPTSKDLQAGVSPSTTSTTDWGTNALNPMAAVKKIEQPKEYFPGVPVPKEKQVKPKVVAQRPSLKDHDKEDDGSFFGDVVDYSKSLYNKAVEGVGGMASGAVDLISSAIASGDDPNFPKEEFLKVVREKIEPSIKAKVELAGRYALGGAMGRPFTPVSEVPKEKQKKFDENFLLGTIGGIAKMAPQMVVPMGGGFILDAIDTGIQSVNSTEQGKKLPESVKSIFGIGSGIVMGAMTALQIDKIFGKQSTKVAQNIAVKTIADLLAKSTKPITTEMFEAAIQNSVKTLKDKIVSGGSKVAKAAVTGGLFGVGLETANTAAEMALNKAVDKDVFEPMSWGNYWGRITKGAASGATMGAILGGVHVPFTKTENYIKNKVSEAKKPEDIGVIKEEIFSNVDKGLITQEQSDAMVGLVDRYAGLHSTIPADVPNKANVIDKIEHRNDLLKQAADLEKQKETLDPAFHPKIDSEIKALNEIANEVNNQILEVPQGKKEGEQVYRVDYRDEKGEPAHKYFNSEEESKTFFNNVPVSPVGVEGYYEKLPVGEVVEQVEMPIEVPKRPEEVGKPEEITKPIELTTEVPEAELPQTKIEKLRAEEQTELDSKIDNA
jgi:hypothetical protein